MKYTTTFRTYDPNDTTEIGWKVESHKTRARLTRRTRWQGSRDGAVFLYDIDDGPLTEQTAKDTAEVLDELIGRGLITKSRGSSFGGFRCIDAGYTVQ